MSRRTCLAQIVCVPNRPPPPDDLLVYGYCLCRDASAKVLYARFPCARVTDEKDPPTALFLESVSTLSVG